MTEQPTSTYYPKECMLHTSVGGLMGTRLDVVLLDVDEARASAIVADCIADIRHMETAVSKFLPDSELSIVNRSEPLSLVAVSPLFKSMLEAARDYRTATLGAFDVTLGRNSAIEFDASGEKLIVPSDGMKLDMGGMAKGVAVDMIASRLRQEQIRSAYIDFGGSSIMGLGSHPSGDGWLVNVTDSYTGRTLRTVTLHDESISTSGNTPTYHGHIINPATGHAVLGDRLSSVVAPSAADAEILSTAWLVTTPDQRRLILDHFNVTQEFVYN